MTFHRRVPWLFGCSAESSNWQEWLRPELTYSNLLMWPRLPYPTLGRSQRHCSAYTPDIADTMQHGTPSIQRQPCADATKGNRENQTHLYKEHPHWRPEADPLPPHPAPLSVRTNVVFVCVGLLLHIFFYSAGPSVPVWAPKRDWLFSLHNQLVKVLISSGTG